MLKYETNVRIPNRQCTEPPPPFFAKVKIQKVSRGIFLIRLRSAQKLRCTIAAKGVKTLELDFEDEKCHMQGGGTWYIHTLTIHRGKYMKPSFHGALIQCIKSTEKETVYLLLNKHTRF